MYEILSCLRFPTILDSWGLTKLEERRIRRDLIQMYKNLNNLEEISFISNPRDNFSKNPYEKRGFRKQYEYDERKF